MEKYFGFDLSDLALFVGDMQNTSVVMTGAMIRTIHTFQMDGIKEMIPKLRHFLSAVEKEGNSNYFYQISDDFFGYSYRHIGADEGINDAQRRYHLS